MTFVSIALAIALGLAIHVFLHRRIAAKGGGILTLYRLMLLVLAGLLIVSDIAGLPIPAIILLPAYVFGLTYLIVGALAAGFWGKVGLGSLGMLYLFLGGYLYVSSQIPYGDAPFEGLSNNPPKPLQVEAYPLEWITGLPQGAAASLPALPSDMADISGLKGKSRAPGPAPLDWPDVEGLFQLDSHIREVLVSLRQRQERELSDMLANLNDISVSGTTMRRNAISRENVENLLRDGAISRARYQTFLETWTLADKDEAAFRSRQRQELFQTLTELLEDPEVTESHRVALIRFLVARSNGDVRLVQPLIRLYDHLDRDYPRLRRLNHEFLALYVQRRQTLLESFRAIGRPCLEPLMDYRRKTISDIRYAQVALDRFLAESFGAEIRPLYGVAEPVAIRNFLNREKYPSLTKLSGAAYDQDYLRQNLIRIESENRVPERDQPVMDLDPTTFDLIKASLDRSDLGPLDGFLIDQNPAIRANLAWALAGRKDPHSVPLVFELMQDVHPEVRRLAALAAGNFQIQDIQGSNDPKFRQVVRMLVNYRTNADAYARANALSSLTTTGDRQKALYVLDLVLNNGNAGHSALGYTAPSWADEGERDAVESLIKILNATPEEPFVKTHALKVLMAMDSPDSLGILLHYLHHIFSETGTRPSLLRFIVPHMTLPQEAENAEDVVDYFADQYRSSPEPLHQPLRTLRAQLGEDYKHYQSAEFFHNLRFLERFDPESFQLYLEQTREHVLLMRIIEYARSTWGFWLVIWPLGLLTLLLAQYGLGLFTSLSGHAGGRGLTPNRHANPAADLRNRRHNPPAAIVPVRVSGRHPGGS